MLNINSLRLAQPLEFDSVSNGEGLRMVLWFQGCFYGCKGCHNPESWQLDGGKVYLIDDIIKLIKENTDSNKITLSGGDPLLQAQALQVLLPKLKALDLNIWMYTGDLYENITKKDYFNDIVDNIDVLVDGPFVEAQLDLGLSYRGSTNQRIIDIAKTKENKEVTLYNL